MLLAVLCVGLLIWFGGPMVAIADWRPLESVTARIVLIAVLLVLWLGKKVFGAVRQKLANRKLFDALGRSVYAIDAGKRPPGNHQIRIDAHGLPGGTYYVRLETATSRITGSLLVAR